MKILPRGVDQQADARLLPVASPGLGREVRWEGVTASGNYRIASVRDAPWSVIIAPKGHQSATVIGHRQR